MARLPLLHKQSAKRGERGQGKLYLLELANRLRSDPTPDECAAAAEALERIAAHKDGPAVAGFVPAHRPPETNRDFDIWMKVNARLKKDPNRSAAYKYVAEENLGESQVKKICLAFDKAQREASDLD